MHFQKTSLLLFFTSISTCILAQKTQKDSIHSQQIETVKINGYFSPQTQISTSNAVSVISERSTINNNNSNLVSSLNTIAGVRMEERSPGSYRLAIRGNMIRSPFGVRNIKVYLDDFPMTDAGGNTYINLLDPASIYSIEVLKGPDGSIFGANSGGVMIINPNGFQNSRNSKTTLNLAGGSFGFAQQQFSTLQKVNENYQFSFDQSFTRSDGYRENSALNKKTFQTAHQWKYSKKGLLKFFVLYSDINYETPGGLTLTQFEDNPRTARPATKVTPSASDQGASIDNETFYAGISHKYQLSKTISNTTVLFGSSSSIKNPFITNYEFRKENNMGYRSYFSYHSGLKSNLEIQLGTEGQKGWYDIDNYDNEKGFPTNPQSHDKLENWQAVYFLRTKITPFKNWNIEASIGFNNNNIQYEEIYPIASNTKEQINFEDKWMPRLGTSYLVLPNLAIRASISSGFSAPTIAEVRSSNNLINRDIKPESGINREVGFRWEMLNNQVVFDLAYYQYQMKNAIIRQVDENGAEFYQNAGKIKQNGFESSILATLFNHTDKFLNSLSLKSSITANHYRFSEYQIEGKNYNGNKLTSVPDWVAVHSLNFYFQNKISFFIQHNFTSSIPLDDANTDFSRSYHLIQTKLEKETYLSKKLRFAIYIGINNLLNEKYSLGNDINAFGGRYYNAAPTRNIFAGIKFKI